MSNIQFLNILSFIVSPLGFVIVFIIPTFTYLFFLYPRYWKHRFKDLTEQFNGKLTYPFCDLNFNFNSRQFRLRTVTAGKRAYKFVLEIQTSCHQNFFLGNRSGRNYVWLNYPTMLINVGGDDYLIGSPSPHIAQQLEQTLMGLNVQLLFAQEFSTFRISKRWEVTYGGAKHTTVATYEGFGKDIEENPLTLIPYLNNLCTLLNTLESSNSLGRT